MTEIIKSYTDIEQSKKLAEILPGDSADMCWGICNETLKYKAIPYLLPWRDYTAKEYYLPCWSLAALLNILNNNAYSIDEDASVNLFSYKTIKWDLAVDNSDLGLITEDNPIDACVKMIYKLKEKDLLWMKKTLKN